MFNRADYRYLVHSERFFFNSKISVPSIMNRVYLCILGLISICFSVELYDYNVFSYALAGTNEVLYIVNYLDGGSYSVVLFIFYIVFTHSFENLARFINYSWKASEEFVIFYNMSIRFNVFLDKKLASFNLRSFQAKDYHNYGVLLFVLFTCFDNSVVNLTWTSFIKAVSFYWGIFIDIISWPKYKIGYIQMKMVTAAYVNTLTNWLPKRFAETKSTVAASIGHDMQSYSSLGFNLFDVVGVGQDATLQYYYLYLGFLKEYSFIVSIIVLYIIIFKKISGSTYIMPVFNFILSKLFIFKFIFIPREMYIYIINMLVYLFVLSSGALFLCYCVISCSSFIDGIVVLNGRIFSLVESGVTGGYLQMLELFNRYGSACFPLHPKNHWMVTGHLYNSTITDIPTANTLSMVSVNKLSSLQLGTSFWWSICDTISDSVGGFTWSVHFGKSFYAFTHLHIRFGNYAIHLDIGQSFNNIKLYKFYKKPETYWQNLAIVFDKWSTSIAQWFESRPTHWVSSEPYGNVLRRGVFKKSGTVYRDILGWSQGNVYIFSPESDIAYNSRYDKFRKVSTKTIISASLPKPGPYLFDYSPLNNSKGSYYRVIMK